jgi:excinuclease UvrABC nuclease subunit
MKGTKTYIYGMLDENDEVIYIGKSINPYNRLLQHSQMGLKRMKIIDYFYDKESYYIEKYLKEGYALQNKELSIDKSQKLEIGEILELKRKTSTKIKDTISGKIFNSFYELNQILQLPQDKLKNSIVNRVEGFEHYVVVE